MELESGASFKVSIYLRSEKANIVYLVHSPCMQAIVSDLNRFIKKIAMAHCEAFNNEHCVDDFKMLDKRERMCFELNHEDPNDPNVSIRH